MQQRAKVKLMLVPTIIVQIGGMEHKLDKYGRGTGEHFVAEEEYSFTKSGFTGYINRIHEDAPGDCSDFDHVGFNSVETAVRAAFFEGDDNMDALHRAKLLQRFKLMVSDEVVLDGD